MKNKKRCHQIPGFFCRFFSDVLLENVGNDGPLACGKRLKKCDEYMGIVVMDVVFLQGSQWHGL